MVETFKKVIRIVVNVLVAFIIIIAAFFILVTLSTRAKGDKVPSVFGYSFLTVQSGSMEGTFSEGDVIVIKKCDAEDINKDDIISFWTTIESRRVINSHRVIDVIKDGDITQFQTKGDANSQQDNYVVSKSEVIGKYKARIPLVGNILDVVSTSIGFLLIIILPLLLFFLYQLYRVIMIATDMKKQAVIEANNQSKQATMDEVEAAKAEAQAMLEEAKRQKAEAEAALKAAQEAKKDDE